MKVVCHLSSGASFAMLLRLLKAQSLQSKERKWVNKFWGISLVHICLALVQSHNIQKIASSSIPQQVYMDNITTTNCSYNKYLEYNHESPITLTFETDAAQSHSPSSKIFIKEIVGALWTNNWWVLLPLHPNELGMSVQKTVTLVAMLSKRILKNIVLQILSSINHTIDIYSSVHKGLGSNMNEWGTTLIKFHIE